MKSNSNFLNNKQDCLNSIFPSPANGLIEKSGENSSGKLPCRGAHPIPGNCNYFINILFALQIVFFMGILYVFIQKPPFFGISTVCDKFLTSDALSETSNTGIDLSKQLCFTHELHTSNKTIAMATKQRLVSTDSVCIIN